MYAFRVILLMPRYAYAAYPTVVGTYRRRLVVSNVERASDVQNLTSSKLVLAEMMTDILESIGLAPSDGSTAMHKRFVW